MENGEAEMKTRSDGRSEMRYAVCRAVNDEYSQRPCGESSVSFSCKWQRATQLSVTGTLYSDDERRNPV